jgi:hypothetical protein
VVSGIHKCARRQQQRIRVTESSIQHGAEHQIRQPILRNFSIDDAAAAFEIASRRSIFQTVSFGKAIDIVARVQRSYWDLVFTLRNCRYSASRSARRTQLAQNKRMVNEGSLAPIGSFRSKLSWKSEARTY